MERGRSVEVKVMKSRLRWVACLPPEAMVISGPGLLPRAMSMSVALLQSKVCVEGAAGCVPSAWLLATG